MIHGSCILVVDDEPQIRRSLQITLEDRGYRVLLADNADRAIRLFNDHPPDVIIMDLLLPGRDGIELTQHIREQSTVPILFLSAIGEETKKVEALEKGADDYVTKPFGMEELLARIRSLLRRTAGRQPLEPILACGDLSINFDRREVRVKDELIKLTPTEYDLLKYMIQNAGKVLTHRTLLSAVWGHGYVDQTQYLRVFVGQLRKKVEKSPARPRYIVTDPGVGYRFNCEQDEPAP